MALLWFIVIGAIAGWLAGQFMKGNGFGLLGDIVVGVVGAFIGGYLFRAAGVELGGGLVGSLIVAFLGAVVLLFLVRLFTGRRSRRRYVVLLPFFALGLLALSSSASAQITLGTASSFPVLAGSAVTNTGPTVVTGDVGVSPGTSVTGFPPGIVTGGSIHSADAVAAQAQSDLTTAYNAAAGLACDTDLSGQDLGGLTLTSGVYCFSAAAALTGTLTLDMQGNPNAFFLFQIGTSLTTASGSTIVMVNSPGATCPSNLFWQVGSSATLGTGSSFAGSILALTSITLNTGTGLAGRALARNGAVTLDTNSVAICAAFVCPTITITPPTLPNGFPGVAYSQTVTASGGVGPYAYAVTSGALPTGLLLDPATGTISGTPIGTGTFNFTITATDADSCPGSQAYTIAIGCPVITLSPSTLPDPTRGVPYNQTVTASGGIAPYTYTVSSGALPTGLVLNPSTGTISGTTLSTGTFSFTITATDANTCTGAQAYSVVVSALAPTGVPTVTPAGLMMLMILLGGVGLIVMKRSSL